jgi:PAS domain S-box-containing protein
MEIDDMTEQKDLFDIFEHDPHYRTIMKRLLEASMEQSFNGVVVTEAGPGYPIVYVNPAFCEMTGYGPHELMGQSPGLLQGPETDPAVLRRLREDITAGRLFHGRAVNYRKDGSTFLMEWKIAPIRGEKGEITHYLAIQREVGGPGGGERS